MESCLTLPKLRKALATLPRTLNETYARILCNIDGEYQQHALHLLQWLAFSERPLNLEELAEVLAIDVNDTPKFDPQRRLADPHDIVEICSSLVTVTSGRPLDDRFAYDTDSDAGSDADFEIYPTRSIVRLAHFSVREYLTSEVIIQGQAAKFGLQKLDCHVSLAKDCLAYLLHFDVAITSSKEEVFAEYPLSRYAAKHWTEHARVAEQRDSTICKDFFLTKGNAFLNWIRLDNPDEPYLWGNLHLNLPPEEIASPLYYASLAGLFETVKTLCDMGADANAIGGSSSTALIAASRNDHIEIANLLLEKGAQVNFESTRGTVLEIALAEGSIEISRLLLEHGAEMADAALVEASGEGRTEAVRLLLEYGADVDIDQEHTAFIAASRSGHTEVVRLLLEHGADVNISKPGDRTALQQASRSGFTDIVRLLLEHGADVDIWEPEGTALQQASFEGHSETVRLLLDHSADVDIWEPEGTALHQASLEGHTTIVRLLLEYGADVNISGPDGAALKLASMKRHIETIRLLLKYNADVNLYRVCGTALQAATSAGQTMVVEMLLEHGADVNIVRPSDRTALQLATEAGHMKIVEMLLEHGADVNISGAHGTALEAATEAGHMVIAEILRKKGARPRQRRHTG